jgi:hypothetical protein
MKYFNFYYAGEFNHAFNRIIAAETATEAQTIFDTWLSGSTENVNLRTAERWLCPNWVTAYGDDSYGFCNMEELSIIGNVDDMGGFDFIRNPVLTGTHIFRCLDGYFVCLSPEPDSRFKYQPVFRQANEAEFEIMRAYVETHTETDSRCTWDGWDVW